MPRFFKRLFKFPQMDFQLAAWELLNVYFSPSKVFRQMYYHVRVSRSNFYLYVLTCHDRNVSSHSIHSRFHRRPPSTKTFSESHRPILLL